MVETGLSTRSNHSLAPYLVRRGNSECAPHGQKELTRRTTASHSRMRRWRKEVFEGIGGKHGGVLRGGRQPA